VLFGNCNLSSGLVWTQKRWQDSFLGPAEEPSSSFTAHSGTAFRTPEGELTLRGTRVYSSPTTLETDQSNPKKSPDTNGTVENNIVFSRAFFQ
jgi:hypothetical protein